MKKNKAGIGTIIILFILLVSLGVTGGVVAAKFDSKPQTTTEVVENTIPLEYELAAKEVHKQLYVYGLTHSKIQMYNVLTLSGFSSEAANYAVELYYN